MSGVTPTRIWLPAAIGVVSLLLIVVSAARDPKRFTVEQREAKRVDE